MGFLQWIKIIVEVLRYAPELITLIKEIMSLIDGGSVDGLTKQQLIVELKEGIREARQKKDVSRLERLHRRLVNRHTDNDGM